MHMPRKGYRPPNTTSALIYIPSPLHKAASQYVSQAKVTKNPGFSLQQFILVAMQEKIIRESMKDGSAMTQEQARIYIPVTDVTEGWPDVEGVDIEETNRAYAAELAKRIQAAYPGAGVEVEYLRNTFGAVSDRITAGSAEEEEEIAFALQGIYDKLMNDSDSWTVMTAK